MEWASRFGTDWHAVTSQLSGLTNAIQLVTSFPRCTMTGAVWFSDRLGTGSPAELKAAVGGDVLELGIENPTDARLERTRSVVRNASVLNPDETVTATNDGISVTSSRARTVGPDLIVALRDASITVTGFNVHSPTLDDVFLATTGETLDETDDRAVDTSAEAIEMERD